LGEQIIFSRASSLCLRRFTRNLGQNNKVPAIVDAEPDGGGEPPEQGTSPAGSGRTGSRAILQWWLQIGFQDRGLGI
jgi:hypothetical protein